MESNQSERKQQCASETAGESSGTTGFSGQGAEYRNDVSKLFPKSKTGGRETFGILEGQASYPLGEEPHKAGFRE